MLRKSAFIAVPLLALGTPLAYAYTGTTIRTMAPCSFIVAGKVLPAGDYELIQTSAREDGDWLIRNLQQDSQRVLFTAEQEDPQKPKLDTYVDQGDREKW